MAANDQPQSRKGAELKPCPCCGGEARFGQVRRPGPQHGGHYIECKECHLGTSLVFPLKDDVTRELAERWNQRAPVSETGPSILVADLDIIGRREKGDENKGRAWWSGGTWLRPGEVVAVLTLPPERQG